MTTVWVIETGEYEQSYVMGVASSLDAAIEFVKTGYPEPHIVEWSMIECPGSLPELQGKFEAVPGCSTEHTGIFQFTEFEVQVGEGVTA